MAWSCLLMGSPVCHQGPSSHWEHQIILSQRESEGRVVGGRGRQRGGGRRVAGTIVIQTHPFSDLAEHVQWITYLFHFA